MATKIYDSSIRSNRVQIGTDSDANKNYTIKTPAVPDGTLEIRQGNEDAPGAVVAKINQYGIDAAKGGGNDHVFFENDKVVSVSYTVTANKNAITAGPITIIDGVTVTIPDGSTWSIV